jgi:hypothetical protein
MYIIQNITSDALQNQTLVLPDGTSFSLTIYFVPMQYAWFITQLVYGSFTLQGMRITNSPNMLNQFVNQLPFGLACYSNANREPSQQQDFSSGASTLYVLTQAEAQEYLEFLKLGIQ